MQRTAPAPARPPRRAPDLLSVDKQFSALSLLDLLEARDLYHVHLSHKRNVVATALGRYRIRKSDPWPDAAVKAPAGRKTKRTLDNSEVRPYSWPCVLVFVEKWVDYDEFHARSDEARPEDMVPRSLYLPDGRVVPVCVVEAPPRQPPPGPAAPMKFPSHLLGGGFPLTVDVQGVVHEASAGCLVTDGHLTYVLTNRHVAGDPSQAVASLLGGKPVAVGRSSAKQLGRLLFQEVYPEWPGKDVYLHLDVGLVEIDDLNRWTARVYGVGELGPLADLSSTNLSLRILGCPVRAYGCASRELRGEIAGLFYRYKSLAGFDYVAEFLIGPREGSTLPTARGDSGTLWLMELPDEKRPLPFAVQWGGHAFAGDGGSQLTYALATCLSTVCNLLEVDVVRDLNNDAGPDFWGMTGHFTIANKAITAFIRNPRLRQLMKANLERVTFQVEGIDRKKLTGLKDQPFVPLADVPDLVWKLGHTNRGQPEHPNHFADMDKPRPEDGKTLLELCDGQPDNVAVPFWRAYYEAVQDPSSGLLPFRVWQIFNEMVSATGKGDAARFVCAAGVLAHYVGDACQPLHISYMFDGIPQDDGSKLGKGVHAAYEDLMVDRHAQEILSGIDDASGNGAQPALVKSGHEAAVAVVALMQKTFDTISPKAIVNTFVEADGGPSAVADTLWDHFGEETVGVMVAGCRSLAMLWDSAWKQGGGDTKLTDLGEVDTADLIALYTDKKFLPSRTIDKIEPLLH